MSEEKKGRSIINETENYNGEKDSFFSSSDQSDKIKSKPNLLLHSCCGPCSTAVVERLVEEYSITIFFYNPNITDEKEYTKRRDSQRYFVEEFNKNPSNPSKIQFKEGPYDKRNFFKVAEAYCEEKEGGRRCQECFKLRLTKTAEVASLLNYDTFGTTLSVSPHKDFMAILTIGNRIGLAYGIGFLDMDFKKKAGFQRSIELSKRYNLYRQDYCGCEYSKR